MDSILASFKSTHSHTGETACPAELDERGVKPSERGEKEDRDKTSKASMITLCFWRSES